MKNKIPPLRRHKPSDRGYVRLDGKFLYLGRWGDPATEQAYARLIGEWLARGRTLPVAQEQISIAEMILAYMKHAATYYVDADGKPAKEQSCAAAALKPLRELYGDTPAAEFGPLRLKAVRDRMIELGWCRTHINSMIGKVKHAFRWATENELIPPSIYQGLIAVAGLKAGRSEAPESEGVKPASIEHVEAALAHLPPTVQAMARVQLLTGARSGEIINLRPCDIDVSTGDVWTIRLARHKTAYRAKKREIFLGKKAQHVIAPFMQDRGLHEPLFSPQDSFAQRAAQCEGHRRDGQKPTPRQTDRTVGDRYTVPSCRRAIERACVQAGVPVWFPHMLRHARAAEIRREFGLDAARAVLGHSSLSTAEIYAEQDFDKARAIASQIG